MEINKIYNENCLETMAKMPDNFIDLTVTSPPYNLGVKHHTGNNIFKAYDEYIDDMPEDEYQQQQIKVLNEMHRILKPNGSVFYNHKVRVAQHKASHPIEWILKSNLTFRQQIVWDRKSSPAVAPIRYMPTTELVFWLTKTPCQPNFERAKIS